MAKPRKQTYTMEMYLNKMKDRDIRSDADVQRLSGQWDRSMINELVVTILTDDYIPPIILGEETSSQLWVIDGLQRSSSLMTYRYGNHKITSNTEDYVIRYRAKAKDENENILVDEHGDIIWEDAKFDMKNKTYHDLPEELKKKFNEYQIETVIHEGCDMKRISQLIRRYNNHTAMNTSQKAFTYIDNFARDIRNITDNRFFMDCGKFTEKERTKGVLERVVLESIMCMFHLDHWKKQTKQMNTYLNENSSKAEFEKLNDNLHRLEKVLSKDLSDIFTSKDSFIWLTLFHKFTFLDMEDKKFADFLKAFKDGLRNRPVNGELFDTADKNKGTKDKSVIIEKLFILETLMNEFLNQEKEERGKKEKKDRKKEPESLLDFLRENVNPEIDRSDMECYEEDFEGLSLNVDNENRLMDQENRPSMIAIVAYGYEADILLDDWLVDFFQRNKTYIRDQKENYLQMRKDLDRYALHTNKKNVFRRA